MVYTASALQEYWYQHWGTLLGDTWRGTCEHGAISQGDTFLWHTTGWWPGRCCQYIYISTQYTISTYLHIYVSAGVVAGPCHVPAPAEEAAGLHVSLCGGGGGAALPPGQGARHSQPGTASSVFWWTDAVVTEWSFWGGIMIPRYPYPPCLMDCEPPSPRWLLAGCQTRQYCNITIQT